MMRMIESRDLDVTRTVGIVIEIAEIKEAEEVVVVVDMSTGTKTKVRPDHSLDLVSSPT